MRDAATVLEIIRSSGSRGLPLERVYRCLFHPGLYLLAYGKLYRNAGAMTPGATGETVDGMHLGKIKDIIGALRSERYRWTPVRRTYIAKKNSAKKRPLGLPTWSGKLLQEVIRLILEAYYEPQFSDRSHGFRPGRGCHTALGEIYHGWHGTVWFIEGDITDCFRITRPLDHAVDTGGEDPWRPVPAPDRRAAPGRVPGGLALSRHAERLSARRGGITRFVQHLPGPAGPVHRAGPAACLEPGRPAHAIPAVYAAVAASLQAGTARRPGGGRAAAQADEDPAIAGPADPGYRRLRYCRYADDWLLGFAGPRHEAGEIKAEIGRFLREQLKLELSPAKTLITHGRTQPARFLGYQVVVLHADDKRDRRGHRSINAGIGLKVPADVIRAKIKPYTHCGKPIRRTERIADTDFSIVAQFQAEFRGIAEYYRLAFNRHRLGKLKYVMERSLVKTLARKYRATSGQIYRRYRAVLATEHGPRRGLHVTVPRDGKKPLVAQWGGISLARDTTPAPLNDDPPRIWSARSELIQRLLASRCEMCETTGQAEVHHIRALKDLPPKGKRAQPAWAKRMAAHRRKTLVVCRACHEAIHAGRPGSRTRTK